MSAERTILLIDDEHDLVETLGEVLRSRGYKIVTAFDGQEGLDRLRSVEPHLIILDMNMPKMGGIVFYHTLANQNHGNPKYPILVLTARSDLAPLFRDLEVDGFMTKPFQIPELLEEVAVIINKRHGSPDQTGKVEQGTGIDLRAGEAAAKKVLIVENDVHVFTKIVGMFAQAGLETLVEKNAADAIETARTEHPDLVLVKMNLPGFSGDILATKLKYMARTSDIPVVLYSDSVKTRLDENVTEHLNEKLGKGALIESDDPKKLLRVVKMVLERPIE